MLNAALFKPRISQRELQRRIHSGIRSAETGISHVKHLRADVPGVLRSFEDLHSPADAFDEIYLRSIARRHVLSVDEEPGTQLTIRHDAPA